MKKHDDFIMLPTSDYCFKQLFQNPQFRLGFLSALLEIEPEQIQETILLPTIMEPAHAHGKMSILDVRVQLFDGVQINIEMQRLSFPHWDQRRTYYLGQMIRDQLEAGESYETLKKCIHVSILDFKLYPKDNRCYRSLFLCDGVTGARSSDMIEFKVIELKKDPGASSKENDIVDWIRFFRGTSWEEFKMLAEKNNYMNLGYELLEQLSADERKKLEYEADLKATRDYKDIVWGAEKRGEERGEERGERRGRLEERQESIQKLILFCQSLGATKEYIIKQIVDLYHLSLEEATEKVSIVLQ